MLQDARGQSPAAGGKRAVFPDALTPGDDANRRRRRRRAAAVGDAGGARGRAARDGGSRGPVLDRYRRCSSPAEVKFRNIEETERAKAELLKK